METIKFEKFVTPLLKKVGTMTMAGFRRPLKVRWKEGQAPVTHVDEEINDFLVKAIVKGFPKHSIVSEELPIIKNASEYTWFVDPIDGTIPFVQGIPFFCNSIALSRGGEIVAGAVFDPNHQELFIGEKGRGAFLNGEKIISKAQDQLAKAFIEASIWPGADNDLVAFKGDLPHHVYVVSDFLMPTLSACYAAVGRMDAVVFAGNPPWDVASSVIICREAGLKHTNLDGSDWQTTRDPMGFVTAKPKLHAELVALIKPYLR